MDTSPKFDVSERFRLDGVDVSRVLCVLLVVLHYIHLRFVLNHFDVDGRLPNRALSVGTGWLRAIGRQSYEIYLFHMFVVLGLMALLKRMHPEPAMIPVWYLAMLLL